MFSETADLKQSAGSGGLRIVPSGVRRTVHDNLIKSAVHAAQSMPIAFVLFVQSPNVPSLPENLVVTTRLPEPGLIEPKVQALIKASGIGFRIGGSRAFYMRAQDYVQVPPPQ